MWFYSYLELGASVIGALVLAGILAGIVLFSLIYQKNWIPRILTLAFVGIIVILFILHFAGVDKRAVGVRIFCLFEGVMNGN